MLAAEAGFLFGVFVGLLYLGAYVWLAFRFLQIRMDWVAFGMAVAVFMAWPAFSMSCFLSASRT